VADPFKIDGPTCLSFSGGSTSGYMLARTLDSNSIADLKQWLRVAFANTGREDEATLRFVRDCARHFAVPIVCLEWRDHELGFERMNFETFSRNGEPFEALIRKRNYLPNPVTRFCTSELKIRTMHRWLKTLGWHDGEDGWDQFIGIRADEQRRVAKIRARGHSTETTKESMRMPLADAGVTWQEVDAFWARQPFKLELARHNGRTLAGNCDLCFLKPPAQRLSLIRDMPTRVLWWARMEREGVTQAARTRQKIIGYRPMVGWVPPTTEEVEAWQRGMDEALASGEIDEWEYAMERHPTTPPTEPIYAEVPNDGAIFAKDGPTYTEMASYDLTQRQAFEDDDSEAIPCFCGD
jgi:3'-phosphoadenosine 5'-phosphosulfate sulfotransferase (PAPS reductase)/FAD synthetase